MFPRTSYIVSHLQSRLKSFTPAALTAPFSVAAPYGSLFRLSLAETFTRCRVFRNANHTTTILPTANHKMVDAAEPASSSSLSITSRVVAVILVLCFSASLATLSGTSRRENDRFASAPPQAPSPSVEVPSAAGEVAAPPAAGDGGGFHGSRVNYARKKAPVSGQQRRVARGALGDGRKGGGATKNRAKWQGGHTA